MMGGADQASRLPAALAAPLFGVDETSPEQLLVQSLRLAGHLRFVGADGRVDGDWSALLDHDESVLIALCQTLDLDRRALDFMDDLAASRSERLVEQLRELTAWLRRWAQALASVDQPWSRLVGERALAAMAGFSLSEMLEAGTDPQSLQGLREAYFTLSRTLEQLQRLTGEAWAASLNSGVHEPAAALLIAFCQVFGRVQARLNQFTERLTDFYYRDCLGMTPRSMVPDAAHIVLRRDPSYRDEVVIPLGTRFNTRSGDGPAIPFLADHALTVTDVRIADLRFLRLQRDPLISPEGEFGYVTRAKTDRLDPAAADRAQGAAMPLLGPDVRGLLGKGEDARIGLAVSSPTLWLKEGERRVEVTLWFDFGEESTEALLAALEATREATTFSRLLGRLFARWVLPDRSALDAEALAKIRSWAPEFIDTSTFEVRDGAVAPRPVSDRGDGQTEEARSPADPLILMLAPADSSLDDERRRSLIREELVENLFLVALSTPEGWCEIDRPKLHDGPATGAPGLYAMTLSVALGQEDPPVAACSPTVHGDEWPIDAPVLRLTVNEQAGLYPYSLTAGVILRALDLKVEVSGLREIQAYNQMGPLDPTRPFMPFGPLPNTASYLVVGATELACKPLTRLTIRPEWAGLPTVGFDRYYAGYGGAFTNAAFAVNPSILRDGLWETLAEPELPLFSGDEQPVGRDIEIGSRELRARWRASHGVFLASPTARNGLVRLQLAQPQQGFGHQVYPTVLTAAMTAKPRFSLLGASPAAPPNPPYTPLIERLLADYAAEVRIDLQAAGAADAPPRERVLYLRPFGVQQIHPAPAQRPVELLPSFGRDANLYIGLDASQAQGVLTLLFELQSDGAVDALARRTDRPTAEWWWLASDGWRRLDDRRILSDSTAGFLTSGVVVLDLPTGLVRDNPLMPGGVFWLRLASDAPSACFAGLLGVHAQALRVTRAPNAAAPFASLPAQSLALEGAALPGVLGLDQPAPTFGLRASETEPEFRARAGERLRHKHRASTPWDFERLVLERFPEVHKVRCLPNCEDRTGARRPGSTLVVVVPTVGHDDPRDATRPARLDPLQLDTIERYLKSLASPSATVRVRNAGYELVQVRCRVGVRPGADVGQALRQVNAAIVAYLSPWNDAGRGAQFDWEIRAEEIEACVRQIPAVESVRGVSMIHIWPDELAAGEPAYRFQDTAADAAATATDPAAQEPARVRRQQPWSLALPLDEHFIEVDLGASGAGVQSTGVTARIGEDGDAGVAGLEIGRTFVVGGAL